MRSFICLLLACINLIWASLPSPANSATSTNTENHFFSQKQYRFNAITDVDFDEISGLMDIAQDRNGFMWLGGESGLMRFDGYNLKLYRNEWEDINSLSHSYVRDILIDHQGRIWVATISGLNLYRETSDDFQNYNLRVVEPDGFLSNKDILCLEDAPGKGIWVGTHQGGLFLFSNKDNAFHQYDQSLLKGENVTALYRDQDTLWVGFSNGHIQLINTGEGIVGQKFSQWWTQNKKNGGRIHVFFRDSKNFLWVGTSDGLYRIDADNKDMLYFSNKPESENRISNGYIQAIAEDAEQNLWVATDGGGVNQLNLNDLSFNTFKSDASKPNELVSDKIRKIFVDRDNNVWLGHFPSGVSLLNRSASQFLLIEKSQTGKTPYQIAPFYRSLKTRRIKFFGSELKQV